MLAVLIAVSLAPPPDRLAACTPAEWERRRTDILAAMQRVMGPLPEPAKAVPLDVRVDEEMDAGSHVRRHLTFAAEPGDRVAAYLLIPKQRPGKTAAMLCLHQTTRHGKAEPAGLAGKPNLHYARELADRGYVTLAPDYPGYGDSKTDSYALGYASATMKGVWNHRRAVDFLQSLPEVDGGRIGVVGHSLGGHNALFAAAFDPRLKVAVTSCGFTSFAAYKGGDLTGWSHKGYMPRIAAEFSRDPMRMPFDFPEVLAVIAPRAVFVSAPEGDDNFAVAGVRACVAAARPVFTLLGNTDGLTATYPAGGHDFPPAARESAYAVLDRVLDRGPTR